MLQDFVLIQRKAIQDEFILTSNAPEIRVQAWFQLKTCLRNMILGPKDELSQWKLSSTDEVIEGEACYQFLLEVICGLHSSLVGETEILGQFKNAVLKFEYPNSHFGFEMKKFFQAILEDVKKVRTKHLSDLGSQSYGSLLRKEIKRTNQTEVHILGAGHLCEEILPWLAKDGTQIHIHVRNLKAAQKKFKSEKIIWHDIQESSCLVGVLIVAAPLDSVVLKNLVAKSPELTQIFDLRHDSHLSSVSQANFSGELKSLTQFMNVLNENSDAIYERKNLALDLISKMANQRAQTVEHRPFGWEDMTA